MDAFWIYKKALVLGTPAIKLILDRRLKNGKEDPARISERKGIASLSRPAGPLLWVHVASVGEAQSVLSLIDLMLSQNPQLNILVTSVTKTSADLLADKLPSRAFHQYAPVDHPDWVRKFLDHWHPNMAIWVESELWPTMLTFLKKRHIPCALLNAHMSPKSYKNWQRAPAFARQLLSVFLVILAQSKQDADYYREFSIHGVVTTDNIKYAAKPLTFSEHDENVLKQAIGNRPVWLYASSHEGEEDLAAETHRQLSSQFPDLLTIIALRHPDRGPEVLKSLQDKGMKARLRGTNKSLPTASDQVYIVDTMGELGLFYHSSPLALVGRSFSNDGGGGHNPIEPALLNCAVLHGPAVQNSAALYREMDEAGAALEIKNKNDLASVILNLLSDTDQLGSLQKRGHDFARQKADVMAIVIDELEPVFLEAHLQPPKVMS